MLPTAVISGSVFTDTNLDRLRQSAERGLVGWRVFLDANNNTQFDPGETSALTNANGGFKFTSLPAGLHTVRLERRPGYRLTTPVAGSCRFVLKDGETRGGRLFGVTQTNMIAGFVYNDVNSNGWKDAGEAGLADWRVYLDLNSNARWDAGEPTSVTDRTGAYKLDDLANGTYTVRASAPATWNVTGPTGGVYVLSPNGGSTFLDQNFGRHLR